MSFKSICGICSEVQSRGWKTHFTHLFCRAEFTCLEIMLTREKENKLFFTLFAIMSPQWGVSVPYFSRHAFVQRAQECCASPLVDIISSRLICNLLTKPPRERTESDTLPYCWWNLGQCSVGDFTLTGSFSGKCFTCPGCWTDPGCCRWIIHRLWRACVLYS